MTTLNLTKPTFSVDTTKIVEMKSIAKPMTFDAFVDMCRGFNKRYLSTIDFIKCDYFIFGSNRDESYIVKNVKLKEVNGKLALVVRLWKSTDLFDNKRESMTFRDIYYKIQELVSKSNDIVDSGMNVYVSHGLFVKKTLIDNNSSFAASCCNINPDGFVRV